jgi:formate dehydrogenase major subunit
VAKEINGYFQKDVTVKANLFQKGRPWSPVLPIFRMTGPPQSGNWLYCNSYTEKGNMAARRGQKTRPTTSASIPSSPGAGR